MSADDFVNALRADCEDMSAKFLRLKKLVDDHDAAIRADPIKHVKEAWEEAFRVRRILHEALEAYDEAMFKPIQRIEQSAVPAYREIRTMNVREEELLALRALYATIKAARDA